MKLVKPSPLDTAALLAFHSLHFGDAKMEDPPAPPADPPASPPAGEKTVPQSEVNAIVAREKDAAKNKALADIQEALGVDIETAKAVLKGAKEKEDSEKSEATKAREAADREKAKAESETSTAKSVAHQANVALEFVFAGVTDRDKVTRYSKMLEVEVGASSEDIRAAVAKLKTDEPLLFGTADPVVTPPVLPPRTVPGSDIKGTPPPPKVGEDRFAAGVERAKQYGSQYAGVMPGRAS